MAGHGEQVSRERLLQLLDQGEASDLDFKAACDLNERSELVAITRDIAAFSARGGHVVVGVHEDGTPSEMLAGDAAKLFDEATLRAKIAPKYLPESISIATGVHEVEGHPVIVVFVAAHPNGFVVMQSDGDFQRPDGKPAQEFRAGDVFVRRGTSSRRWNQQESDEALACAMAARREQWRKDLRGDLASLGLAQQAQGIAKGPAGSFTWQMDNDAFEATLVELLRGEDDIPITLSFDQMRRDSASALEDGRGEDVRTIIDRVSSAAALAVSLARPALLAMSVETLLRIYSQSDDSRGFPRSDLSGLRPAELWLEVITRVYAVGGLAVRERDWQAVRLLAVQRGTGHGFEWFTNWLRHALTEAARAGHLEETNEGRRIDLSLLNLALAHTERLAALRPDLPAGDDALLTSLTQFDLLSIFAAIAEAGELDDRGWYTNFARFDWHRSEPALVGLLQDHEMRSVLFPLGDGELAAAIREVSRMARSEGLRYTVWRGWNSPVVEEFLAAHPSNHDEPKATG